MVFQRGSTSTDNLPFDLKRSHCVKIPSPLNTPDEKPAIPKSAWEMYDDIDDNDVNGIVDAAQLPTTSPWIKRGSAVPPRAPRQLNIAPPTRPPTVTQQLLKAMRGRKSAPAPRKRGGIESDLDSEDERLFKKEAKRERKAQRTAKTINDFEPRSEDEEEPSSEDEGFVKDDDDSDSSLASTGEESQPDSSDEAEAEFSDEEESDEEEVEDDAEASDGEEESSDEEVLAPVRGPLLAEERTIPMTAKERAIMSTSVASLQMTRRLTPLVIMADSHITNIVVSMFWAWQCPVVHDMKPLDDALVEALHLVCNNKPLTTSDVTVGAGYVWLINHAKLRRNLTENYDSPALHSWLDIIVNSENVDDTPVFVYQRKKTQHCFLDGSPCNRGVQLIDNRTKEPLGTLWFDATNDTTNLWVLNLIRYLFLPATLAQFCRHEIGKRGVPLLEDKMRVAYTWVNDISAQLSLFLYQEGVCKVRAGGLDCEYTRNYVK